MIRSLLCAIVAIAAIGGCAKQESAQAPVPVAIRPGMNYAQARALLTSSGLKEIREAIWAIQPPENIEKVFTFFLDGRSALLVYVERDSGEIASLARLAGLDKQRAFREWNELDSFVVHVPGPLSNTTAGGDGK